MSNFELLLGPHNWLGSNYFRYSEFTILRIPRSYLTNCIIVVFEKKVFFNISVYILMLNSKPLLSPQNWSGGHDFNNLYSTLSEDACTLISQIVAL